MLRRFVHVVLKVDQQFTPSFHPAAVRVPDLNRTSSSGETFEDVPDDSGSFKTLEGVKPPEAHTLEYFKAVEVWEHLGIPDNGVKYDINIS